MRVAATLLCAIVVIALPQRAAGQYATDVNGTLPTRKDFDAFVFAEFEDSVSADNRAKILHAIADWASPEAPQRVLLDLPVEMSAILYACASEACRAAAFELVDIPYMYIVSASADSSTTVKVTVALVHTLPIQRVGELDTVSVYTGRDSVSLRSLDTPRVSQVMRNLSEGRAELVDETPTPPWDKRFGIAALGGVRFGDSISPAAGLRLVLALEGVRIMLEGVNYFPYGDSDLDPGYRRRNLTGAFLMGYAWQTSWGDIYSAIGPQFSRTCMTSTNVRYEGDTFCGSELGGKVLIGTEVKLADSLAVFADAGFQLHFAGSPHWPEVLGGIRWWMFQ